MANKHMKRYSLSVVIREMHIKTANRYHFISTRSAIDKKIDSNKCFQEFGEIGMVIHYW